MNNASGLEHRFQAGVHFFLFDKLATLSRRDSLFHGGEETGFLVEITSNHVRYQPLWNSPGIRRDLRKAFFLFRCEMDRHHLQSTGKPGGGQYDRHREDAI